MLAMIELEYSTRDKFKTLSRRDYEEIRQQIPSLSMSEWPENNEQPPEVYVWDKRLIDLVTDGPLLARHGIEFKVKNFKDSYRIKSQDGVVNNNLHVAIPNIGLLAIDEVMVLEDACTDNLQKHLDDGWRLVS